MMRNKIFMVSSAVVIISLFITAFSYNTMHDTVVIGTQVWSNQNLGATQFRNGDLIPQAKTPDEWVKAGKAKQPAWCYPFYNSEMDKKYGKLYNWYAVNDSRGLSPEGFHVPNLEEWFKLINYLGGENTAGLAMKSTSEWYKDGNGNNSSGLNIFPVTECGYNGEFDDLFKGSGTTIWTSSSNKEGFANCFVLLSEEKGIFKEVAGLDAGHVVRCVKD